MNAMGKPKVIPWLHPRSADRIEIQEGDVYEFLCPVSTRAGHVHMTGELLHVHDRTGQTPFGEIGPQGHNWICRTRHGLSVWTTLEHCIERGLLRKQPEVSSIGKRS
jgi:hypothetical protein